MTSIYASKVDLASRRAECGRIQVRHPNMIPVVLEATGKHAKVSFIALSPATTIATLQVTARDVSSLAKKKPVALSVAGCMPSTDTTMGDLYENCKAEDGFLYVSYSAEKVMGSAVAAPCFAYSNDGGSSTTTTPGQLVPDTPGLTDAAKAATASGDVSGLASNYPGFNA